MVVAALRPVLTFEPIGHLGKQHDAADAQIPGASHLVHQTLQAPALGPGHGANGLVAGPLVHEQGINEIAGTELVLPHQGPQGRRSPQTTRAVGELHRRGPAGRILSAGFLIGP